MYLARPEALHRGHLCPPRFSGAQVFRWHAPRRRGQARIPGASPAAIYAANTLGGIVGALAVSLVLIPWIGSQQTAARSADRVRR